MIAIGDDPEGLKGLDTEVVEVDGSPMIPALGGSRPGESCAGAS